MQSYNIAAYIDHFTKPAKLALQQVINFFKTAISVAYGSLAPRPPIDPRQMAYEIPIDLPSDSNL